MDTNDIDRRTVLRRVTTTTLAAGLTATTASGAEPDSLREQLAAAGITDDAFDAESLPRREPGELIDGGEGVTRVETSDGSLVVAQRETDAGLVRTFNNPATDRAYAVVERNGSRLLVDNGVTDLSTTGTCEDECSASNCYYESGQVVLDYEVNNDGYCVVTDYDCGCR